MEIRNEKKEIKMEEEYEEKWYRVEERGGSRGEKE